MEFDNNKTMKITELYDKYYNLVYYIIQTHIWFNNDEDIRELVQEVFLLSMDKYAEMIKSSSNKAWLSKTAYFLTMNYNRKYLKILKSYEILEKAQEVETDDFVDHIVLREQIFQIYQMLNSEEKLLYKMLYIREMSLSEIGKSLGIKYLNANMKVVRLKKRLRYLNNLIEKGGDFQ